ncbi:methylenetetrahydrofolate reductase (NADPH) [Ruminococcaceae bacterium YAD3003]|nr:methylenetetrahydrofolate reductase (NADPH) [Ruminococcaceae bacterium YAD3003]
MKINEILKEQTPSISFEVFPPKKEADLDNVKAAAGSIAALKPSFMSVTYGAAGSTSKLTIEVASDIKNLHGVSVLPHLTCVASTKEHVDDMIKRIRENNIDNIMALRGDIPKDGVICHDFEHASDLIRHIKSIAPDLCIGGACYPEGHVECARKSDDIHFLKEKVDAGCDFLTTQMFFDNNIFYNFLYRVKDIGINVPVLPGIMPVTTAKQLSRSVQLSGTAVPERFKAIVDRFGDDPVAMRQAGIVYATEQIIDLIANGVNHIHVYSMNKPDVAADILNNLKGIVS